MRRDRKQSHISVMVLGLRGVPDIQGGVETHVSNLYPLLSAMGCKVEVVVRSPFYKGVKKWNNLVLHSIWSPRAKGVEAFIHTFLGTIYAVLTRPDLLHIHAVGPMLMTPLARIFGLRVVVTHHGPDYEREKWGRLAGFILRTGEKVGSYCAHKYIVISKVIEKTIRTKYGIDPVVIPNGVNVSDRPYSDTILKKFGINANKYVLQVSRFVPEKRQIDLIRAFEDAALDEWKLVLVGDVETRDDYVDDIISRSSKSSSIVLTGFQTGESLAELYSSAGIFVLPSSHEGLPIAMLEALSYGLNVIASDIPANLEIGLPEQKYYPLGNIERLSSLLKEQSLKDHDKKQREAIKKWVSDKYNWQSIAEQTLAVYKQVIGRL